MEWVSGLGVLVAIHLLVFLVPIPIKYRIHYKKQEENRTSMYCLFFLFFLINFNIYINQIEAGALQSTSQIVLKTSGRLILLKQKDLEDERESLAVA